MTKAVLTVRLMLTIASGSAIALFGIGLICVTAGKPGVGWGLRAGSTSEIDIWLLQKALVKKIL